MLLGGAQMKITTLFGAAVLAMALGSSPAAAVVFSGSTTGCFGSSCSAAPIAITDQLAFVGNPFFSGSTTTGPLDVNFGGFGVSNPSILFLDFNDSYNGQTFNLTVNFTAPAAASPNQANFSANLTGTLNWLMGGQLTITFGGMSSTSPMLVVRSICKSRVSFSRQACCNPAMPSSSSAPFPP